ncbi:MAG: hypothetical protein KBA06_01725 [Saprospiraceae bacterium]|nr:hypothetical protein [Saprospiraceae bacterium]
MKSLVICLLVVINTFGYKHNNFFKGESDLLITSNDKSTIIYDRKTQNFYHVQSMHKIQVPKFAKFVAYDNKGSLTILDTKKDKTISYKLDANVYGISNFKGEKYSKALIFSNQKGMLIFNAKALNLVNDLTCGCYANESKHNCQSGGANANSCTNTDEGTITTVKRTNTCAVTCGSGYYACCNK